MIQWIVGLFRLTWDLFGPGGWLAIVALVFVGVMGADYVISSWETDRKQKQARDARDRMMREMEEVAAAAWRDGEQEVAS